MKVSELIKLLASQESLNAEVMIAEEYHFDKVLPFTGESKRLVGAKAIFDESDTKQTQVILLYRE